MSTAVKPIQRKELFGHPVGLFILFFTEMWERFSYYGMRGILVLYIVASATAIDPGLGWSNKDALWLYGWYTMLVYVASIPGGWIADKFLGQKKTVMLGGLLLCCGHGILAIPQDWAFFTGLILIILGVGGLKPNISTMVGGLYQDGDIRRDSGFTIFYIGINVGAFLASISVGLVAYYYGWHYGFGLAGIGMLFGQIVFIWGQKFLKGIGEYTGGESASEAEKAASKRPLNKVEKDRVIVLLISFLIVVVFWGAFEQAGGLMNLYTDAKVDRTTGLSWMEEIPAAVFQSLNAGYIIIFGTIVGGFWIWWKKSGRESSSLFKMAVGTIIMGLGYVFMMFASQEASAEVFGKAAMYWIFLAYLFHTIGELCTSPVALSFITKLAPLKYASIMMGVYFAATGFGNLLAGKIGESAQLESFSGTMVVSKEEVMPYLSKTDIEIKNEQNKVVEINDFPINQDKNFEIRATVYPENGKVMYKRVGNGETLNELFELEQGEESSTSELLATLRENNVTASEPYHARLIFEKDGDKAQILENKGDGKDYGVSFVLEEEQSEQEFATFMWLTVFTVAFGLLVLLFLKKLKKLTHGAEDNEHEIMEQEPYELGNPDLNK
ncbi:peptide MFS transporter [Subsaximicrobium wynnwilliamsii]|uniref:Peptide MFS transporter n=1 Tax=Subsaximicrobium wynnwilliamsii TaxID=291179 RepID=A0A5C6ZHL0_9FLAO|nr:peptide MFS transporter [Subsaximicrobium wynnwilliamsii]TXD83494.1 peptide MFS transporter [Subsaximicrobium wynnwilliamsii]TXD89231.1 peptide MFS transporter [Subsaximicrobium wynnwilliamsii]TXE03174.1 peptide MFS transporter [Subsaximicrobium wynnwilliamsii]